jgi:CRISPR system Cascade subunit CasE
MFMSSARLKAGERGGSGALAAFLAGSAENIGQSHHLIWSLFGDRNGRRPFLYRLTGSGPTQPVLVYSQEKPEDHHDLWDLETKPFALPDQLKAGDRVAWSIRVNATVKSEGKRHDIVMRARRAGGSEGLDALAARLVPLWLEPKLRDVGLNSGADDMLVESYARRRFAHNPRGRGAAVTIATTDVRGIGTVTDQNALGGAVRGGIGSGRAYGCGMLLLRRV